MNKQAMLKYEWFKSNVGFIDRELRLIIGSVVLLAIMVASPLMTLSSAIVMLAMVPVIISGITGWDPLYALVGISSQHNEENIEQRDWACPNVGTVDRIARLTIGVALIIATLMGVTQTTAAIVAVPLVLSALIAWDPFYAMMRVNTIASTAELKSTDLEIDGVMLNSCYTVSNSANPINNLLMRKAA
jgi:hypothetical protein